LCQSSAILKFISIESFPLNINSIDQSVNSQFFIKRYAAMTRFVIVLCVAALVAVAVAEKPAPYPAKGWKPQGARLELPREYGAPREQRTEVDDIEFTTLSNEYLPQATTIAQQQSDDDDVLRVQALPAADSFSQFRQFQRQRPAKLRARPQQQQAARLQVAPAPAFGKPFLLSPNFAPQFAQFNQQLQEQQFVAQQREYGVPKINQPEVRSNAPEIPEVPQTTNQPENENDDDDDEPQQPRDDQQNDYDDEREDPVIAVSNADDSQQQQSPQQQGQYYLLLPDQSLQKVRFATAQTAEDRQANGFSAQLR